MEIYAMPGHLIRRLNQISTGLFLERMNSLGLTLTPVQFAVLSALRLHPGIDQATVAGLVAYDRATIARSSTSWKTADCSPAPPPATTAAPRS